MLLDFSVVFHAVLMVLGILWCREMFGRWRSDLDEFRSSTDGSERAIIVFFWTVTMVIVVSMGRFVAELLIGMRLL